MKKCIVEFIGTFFLMLAIVMTLNWEHDGAFRPLAIGAMLMAVIYAGGHISRAHYNPAVTLAIWMRGKIETKDVPGYLIAQFLGAVLATLLGLYVYGKGGNGGVHMTLLQGMTAEILGTFILAFVILNVAFTKTNAGNSFYGIAISFTVIGCAYTLGSFGSEGCFNPAVALGTMINGVNPMGNVINTILSNLIGGALAAVVFNATYERQDDYD